MKPGDRLHLLGACPGLFQAFRHHGATCPYRLWQLLHFKGLFRLLCAALLEDAIQLLARLDSHTNPNLGLVPHPSFAYALRAHSGLIATGWHAHSG